MVSVNDFYINNDKLEKTEDIESDNTQDDKYIEIRKDNDFNNENNEYNMSDDIDEQVDLYDGVSERLAEATGKTLQYIWNYYVWYKLSELEEKGISKDKLNEIEKMALIDDKEIPFMSLKYIWRKCIMSYKVIVDNVEIIEAVVSIIPFVFMIHMKYTKLNKMTNELEIHETKK